MDRPGLGKSLEEHVIFRSLRSRLVLLVLLSALPALILIVVFGIIQINAASADARDQALNFARNVRERLANVHEDADLMLSLLRESPSVRGFGKHRCETFLAHVLADHPQFANIGVISSTGTLTCSAVPHSSPVYLGDRAYFKNALKTTHIVQGVFQTGRVIHVPMIVYAVALPGGRASHAVAYASIRLTWINELLAESRFPKGTSILLLDANNVTLARYPVGRQVIGQAADDFCRHVGPDCVNPDRIFPTRDLDGRINYVGQALFTDPSTGDRLFNIFVGFPRHVVLGSARRIMAASIGIFATLIGMLLFITWYGGEKLVLRHVRTLMSVVRQIASGDLTARVHVKGPLELTTLAATVNDMTDALEARTGQTERQLRRIDRLVRIYRVLSGINAAILRIRDEQELLAECCRIAVVRGGFATAWVHTSLPGNPQSARIAHQGRGETFTAKAVVSIHADTPEGQGPSGHAMRTGQPYVCNNAATDPELALWRDDLLAIGCHSVGSFPITIANQLFGCLVLYAEEDNFFNHEEIALFAQVAADTGLGLEHIRIEQSLERISNFDPLTNIPKRGLFEDRTQQAIAHAANNHGQVAVLAIDLMNMSSLADARGTAATDRVIRSTAEALQNSIAPDDPIGTTGNGTFFIALSAGETESVTDVSNRCAELFPLAVEIGNETLMITARTGVACYPRDGSDAASLTRRAERAMNSSADIATASVRFYTSEMDTIAERRFSLQRALHSSLAHNELKLFYQPVFALATSRIVGVEALLRWNSPEFGPVSPAEFIPIAEASDLIVPIGEWVLRTACQQALAWGDIPGFIVRVAVNVSLIQLHDQNFVASVRRILRDTGLDLRNTSMVLEITESEMAYDVDRTVAILGELRNMGFLIYVDDFGTGYSSLGYLKRLPIDGVKIDRIFVKDLQRGTEGEMFIRTIMSLTSALGLRVVAEGIETREQLEILRELGCQFGQGYLVSPAISPEALLEMLSSKT